MRLDQPIDVMGKFWLPEQSEEDGVTGRLRIEDGGNIQLELYQSSDVYIECLELFYSNIPILHGRLNDGRLITLKGNIYATLIDDDKNGLTSTLFPSMAIIGWLFNIEKPLMFHELEFQMTGLNDWLYKYPIFSDNGAYENKYVINLGRHHDAIVDIIIYFNGDRRSNAGKSNKYSTIRVRSERPRDWKFFNELTRSLSLFFAIVCNRNASAYNIIGRKTEFISNFNIYFSSPSTSRDFVDNPREKLLFVYRNVAESASKLIGNWLKFSQSVDYAIILLLSNKETQHDRFPSKFLKLMQALEVFAHYYLRTNEYLQNEQEMQKKQLVQLIEDVGQLVGEQNSRLLSTKLASVMGLSTKYILSKTLFGLTLEWQNQDKVDDFLKLIYRLRNAYTHGSTSNVNKLRKKIDFNQLMLKLECCIRLLIFHNIGFEKEELYNLIERSGWFKQKLGYSVKLDDPK